MEFSLLLWSIGINYDPFYDYYSQFTIPFKYFRYYNHHHFGNYHGWNFFHTTNSTDYVFGHRGSINGRNRHLTVKSNLKNSINNTINTCDTIIHNNISVVKLKSNSNDFVKSTNKDNSTIKTNYNNIKTKHNTNNTVNKSNTKNTIDKKNTTRIILIKIQQRIIEIILTKVI